MRVALPLLLAALVLTAASPTGSDRYRRGPCSWQPSKTIYRDSHVRVFKHHSDRYTSTYACLRTSGTRRWIAYCADEPGPAVDPKSFAVGGRRIYWTHDGEPRMATMP